MPCTCLVNAGRSPCPAHPNPVGANPTFGDVAEELEAAREHLDEALDAWTRALSRFKAHPLYQQLRAEELA